MQPVLAGLDDHHALRLQRRLRRAFVRVPVLTPWLSSRWLGLVTPVYARVGQKLIDGLRNETIVTSPRAAEHFPETRPRGMREAMAQALANEYTNLSIGGVSSGPLVRNKSFYNLSYQLGRQSRANQTLLGTNALGLRTAGIAMYRLSGDGLLLAEHALPERRGRCGIGISKPPCRKASPARS